MLNLIKTAAITLADGLNGLRDPFEPFTRPAQPKDLLSLSSKAAMFESDLLQNFLVNSGTIINYRIPLPIGAALDLGDQALWHGVYTFTLTVAQSLEPNDGREGILSSCLAGLAQQQPNGRLIRGVDGSRTQGDASNDQATGHLLGLYGLWVNGNKIQREGAGQLIDEWAQQIVENDYALVDASGVPTTYGRLEDGWKTDPLRLTLLLAIISLADVVTEGKKYLPAEVDLLSRYDALIPYPKVRLWSWDTTYDTHRAAIHLMVLHKTAAPRRCIGLALDGVQRLRTMVQNDGNIWVNALCSSVAGHHPDDEALARKVLSEFSYDEKCQNVERVNSLDPSIDKVWWAGQWCSRQPIPRWRCSAQDFFWQRNLYALDKRGAADSRYNGGDFLAAYWMSRACGILTAED